MGRIHMKFFWSMEFPFQKSMEKQFLKKKKKKTFYAKSVVDQIINFTIESKWVTITVWASGDV